MVVVTFGSWGFLWRLQHRQGFSVGKQLAWEFHCFLLSRRGLMGNRDSPLRHLSGRSNAGLSICGSQSWLLSFPINRFGRLVLRRTLVKHSFVSNVFCFSSPFSSSLHPTMLSPYTSMAVIWVGQLGLTKYRLWQKWRQLTRVYCQKFVPDIIVFQLLVFGLALLQLSFVTLKLTHKSVDTLSAVLHDSCIDLHVGRAS